jgi:predicted flap endonuclease-1-like 5' DNA nuclease
MSSPDALPRVGAPAARALAGLGITSLGQLAGHSRAQLEATHGIGPKALGLLEEALAERGLRLAD